MYWDILVILCRHPLKPISYQNLLGHLGLNVKELLRRKFRMLGTARKDNRRHPFYTRGCLHGLLLGEAEASCNRSVLSASQCPSSLSLEEESDCKIRWRCTMRKWELLTPSNRGNKCLWWCEDASHFTRRSGRRHVHLVQPKVHGRKGPVAQGPRHLHVRSATQLLLQVILERARLLPFTAAQSKRL